MMLYKHVSYLLTVSLMLSCSAPLTMEDFRSMDDRDSLGRFSYELDMSDSLAVYDISFYTRLDQSAKDFADGSDVCVDIEFVSPSGATFSEVVYIPHSSFSSRRKGTYDCLVEYRIGSVPVEWGVWKMNLTVPQTYGMRGMGVINKKR